MIDKFDIRYAIGQAFVNPVFRLHFKKLKFYGKENIPQDKPIIFAPTHRNALVDALVLVYENRKKQVVFLARADIFKNKKIAKILHLMRIVPVYRLRDGQENLSKNQEIFDTCGKILQKHNPICLFPEAVHNPHQSLLPLQKAASRIALPTEANTNWLLDTHIVPIAFHYTAKDSYLSDLHVTYGEAIRVTDYREVYESSPNLAINRLRKDLDSRLRSMVVDIPNENYDEYLALIEKNSYGRKEAPIPRAQEIIALLNTQKEQNRVQFDEKMAAVREALVILQQKKLHPIDLSKGVKSSFTLFLQAFLLFITLPLAAAGLLNALLPILSYRKFLSLFKDKQFISSARIVSGVFILPLFFLLQTLILFIVTNNCSLSIVYLLASVILFLTGSYWRKKYSALKKACKLYCFHRKESKLFANTCKDLSIE